MGWCSGNFWTSWDLNHKWVFTEETVAKDGFGKSLVVNVSLPQKYLFFKWYLKYLPLFSLGSRRQFWCQNKMWLVDDFFFRLLFLHFESGYWVRKPIMKLVSEVTWGRQDRFRCGEGTSISAGESVDDTEEWFGGHWWISQHFRCKQKKTLANLSRIRGQQAQLGMKDGCAAEGPAVRPQQVCLECYPWYLITGKYAHLPLPYVMSTTSTMNSCSVRIPCPCVPMFRFRVLGRGLQLIE